MSRYGTRSAAIRASLTCYGGWGLSHELETGQIAISRNSELGDPAALHRRTDQYMASPREAYRAIAPPSARFDVSANSMPVLRSLITNVLFSPSVDHGPRDTSLNSTNRQSVISVSFNPR